MDEKGNKTFYHRKELGEMLVFFVCLYIFFPKLLHKCENTQCVYFCFMCMCV